MIKNRLCTWCSLRSIFFKGLNGIAIDTSQSMPRHWKPYVCITRFHGALRRSATPTLHSNLSWKRSSGSWHLSISCPLPVNRYIAKPTTHTHTHYCKVHSRLHPANSTMQQHQIAYSFKSRRYHPEDSPGQGFHVIKPPFSVRERVPNELAITSISSISYPQIWRH